MNKIAIIGTGRIGKAIEHLLQTSDLSPNMWDINPDMPRNVDSLADAVADVDIIFICVPSWVVRSVIVEMQKFVKPDVVFVVLSKGIEENTFKTMDLLLAELVVDAQSYALLFGPTMAEDILADSRAATILASPNPDIFAVLQDLFRQSRLVMEYSEEVHSVALTAVLKNIYAMAMGMASALEVSDNANAMLMVHIIKEMRIILERLGGNPDIVLSLAGLGDMVLTGFSKYSRNRATGRELLEQGKLSKKSEGYTALPSLVELLENNLEDLPLLQALQSIAIDGMSAQEVMDSYLDSK